MSGDVHVRTSSLLPVPQTVVCIPDDVTLRTGSGEPASGLAKPAALAIAFKESLRSERVASDWIWALSPKKSMATYPGESFGVSVGSSQVSPCFSFMPIATTVLLSSRNREKERVPQSRSSTCQRFGMCHM